MSEEPVGRRIHPDLRWHALSSRYIVAPLSAAIALGLGAFALFTGTAWPSLAVDRDERLAFAITILTCGSVAVMVGWVAWSAFRDEYAWCIRLTSLLQREPVTVHITALGWLGEGLPVLEVQRLGTSPGATMSVVCMPSTVRVAELPGTDAHAYFESPDAVVLDTQHGLLWPVRR
jgi:hypothetical protein